MQRICLVSCGLSKKPQPTPAAALYTSSLFQKSAGYAKSHADHWFILSAKHGLVHPETVLAPYDESLHGRPKEARLNWAAQVASQVRTAVRQPSEICILAGTSYREPLEELLTSQGHTIVTPLKGLGIGRQLQYLTAANVRH